MKYVFEGPGPVHDPVLGLVRPGDERELPSAPDWGPWRALGDVPAVPDMARADMPAPGVPVTIKLPTAAAAVPKGM